MEQNTIESVLALEKTIYAKLTEVSSLTEMLSEAVGRDDPVSIRMVIDMRQAPLNALQDMDENLRASLLRMPESDAIRMAALLNGEPATAEEEQALAEQVAVNGRLLRQILAADRRISLMLGGKHSVYQTFRTPENRPQ